MREIVRSKIESAAGLPVNVGQVGLTLGLNVFAKNIRIQEVDEESAAGARIGEILLDWQWRDIWPGRHKTFEGIRLDDALLTFRQNADGAWTPAAFNEVFTFLNQWSGFDYQGEPALPTVKHGGDNGVKASERERGGWRSVALRRLEINRAEVVWRDQAGVLLGEAGPVQAELVQLPIRNRTAYYVRTELKEARVHSGRELRDFTVEVLRGHKQTILINMDGAWHQTPGSSTPLPEVGQVKPKPDSEFTPVPVPVPVEKVESKFEFIPDPELAPARPAKGDQEVVHKMNRVQQEPVSDLESYLRDELKEVIAE